MLMERACAVWHLVLRSGHAPLFAAGWMDIIRGEKRVAEQQSSSVEDAAGVGRAGPIAVAAVQQVCRLSSSLLYMAGDDEMRMLC